jgi:uncharacterized membrane protein
VALDHQAMSTPASSLYQRWVGWDASALRRLATAAVLGLAASLGLAGFTTWQIVLLCGWDTAALTYLVTMAPILLRADGASTQRLAVREDLNRDVARLLLLAASSASLVAVGFAVGLARREGGAEGVLLVTMAAVTIVLSWTVVNTLFTLRYAHLYYSSRQAREGADIDFGDGPTGPPDYRDFAYLAFTIGMTYQVSDTTLRARSIRRTVLVHALVSYVFGVVIVSVGVNTVAGLLG